jgi:hypothetical protein
MSACLVPLCPALAVAGDRCALHQKAQTVKQSGWGGQKCVECGRALNPADYVWTNARRHVQCEPKHARMPDQEKPLLDLAEIVGEVAPDPAR